MSKHKGIFLVFLLAGGALWADPVPVRYAEGMVRGFLLLRTLEGKTPPLPRRRAVKEPGSQGAPDTMDSVVEDRNSEAPLADP
jgi:hypothetical protein